MDGTETFGVTMPEPMPPGVRVSITVHRQDKATVSLEMVARLDTTREVLSWLQEGVLAAVVREVETQDTLGNS